MKNKQNQSFKSLGVLSVFLMMGVCGIIAVPIWNSGSSGQSEKTAHRAEGLAYQILQARKESAPPAAVSGRTPASVPSANRLEGDQGVIGTDLWGRPFHFAVISSDAFSQKLLVWSDGPNGKADTSVEKIDSNRDASEPVFAGDDVGVIVSVK